MCLNRVSCIVLLYFGGFQPIEPISRFASLTAILLIEHWYPQPLVIRLIARARTLATVSPLVATAAGMVGGGGAGYLILQGINLLNPSQYFAGIWIVVLLALSLDILIGLVQMILVQPSRLR